MVMKYNRNKNKTANDDIAELVFLCSEDKIQVTYHTEDKRIASSTREYLKPHNWDEKGATLTFSADMHQTFQVRDNFTHSSLQVGKLISLIVVIALISCDFSYLPSCFC